MISLELIILLFLLGVYCNMWLNKQLKGMVGEPLRIPGSRSRFANPSGHAQFFAFVTVFWWILYMNETHSSSRRRWFLFLAILFAFLSITNVVVCLREKFHTPRHLLWGALVGTMFAVTFVYFSQPLE